MKFKYEIKVFVCYCQVLTDNLNMYVYIVTDSRKPPQTTTMSRSFWCITIECFTVCFNVLYIAAINFPCPHNM